MRLADFALVGGLALLVWVFFSLVGMQLDGAATTAVVVLCAVAVFLLKSLRRRPSRDGGAPGGVK